jgi:hypothetical protein
MSERVCGGCTACCRTHRIPELEKPEGDWCIYCKIGRGCRIYDERPKTCRDFRCAWLTGLENEEERPDKTGIVPDYKQVKGWGLVALLYEASPGALKGEFAKRRTKLHLGIGNCVMHYPLLNGAPKFYLTEGRPAPADTPSLSERHLEIVPFLRGRF